MGKAHTASMTQGKGGGSEACGCCQPTDEEIARHAYELWLERGATHGHDLDDWLEAQRALRRTRRRQRHGMAA